jgi:hypothetical protein
MGKNKQAVQKAQIKSEVVEAKEEQSKEIKKEKETEYPSELLAKSEAIKKFGLHQDIIRAILHEQSYTITDAIAEVQRYINSFKKKGE